MGSQDQADITGAGTSVLITGGAGFIGSHLAGAFAAAGASVTVLDDLSTGRESNLQELARSPGFRFVRGSAADGALLDREVPAHDIVYHLASTVGVRLVIGQTRDTIDRTYGTTAHVARACSHHDVPMVITSSSEVYGRSPEIPFCEDSDMLIGTTENPRWAYSCSKALGEFLALAYHREGRLRAYVVRLFNVCGRRQVADYGMVLPRFVDQALRGEPLTVHGDGLQTRTFASVIDIVEALRRLPSIPDACGRVINLGGSEEISILDLARRVVARTKSSSTLRHVSYAEAYGADTDDVRRRVPDLRRAADLLGWAPRRSLDEVIDEVIDYRRAAQNGS